MPIEKIKVIAYSGQRSEERPMAFYISNEKIEVAEIIDTWLEEDSESRTRKRFFRLKGRDNYIHKIYYDEIIMEWFLVK